MLVSSLEYIKCVLEALTDRVDQQEDDLSELQTEQVPDDVRNWLAATFAKPKAVYCKEKYFLKRICIRLYSQSNLSNIFRFCRLLNLYTYSGREVPDGAETAATLGGERD